MYELAKKARERMKAKARSLAAEKNEKVDSSNWSPAEPLNADVKTGARPVGKGARLYKKGGKVVGKADGKASAPRADRKARKAGGRAVEKEIGIGMANKDVRAANEQREGKKHVGAFKKGGRTKKDIGGTIKNLATSGVLGLGGKLIGDAAKRSDDERDERDYRNAQMAALANRKSGGKVKRKHGGNVPSDAETQTNKNRIGDEKIKPVRGAAQHYKKGGKIKKADGGSRLPEPDEAIGSEVRMKGLKVMPSQENSAAAQVTPSQLRREEGYSRADMKAKRKSGGRTKKMDGGMMGPDQRMGMVSPRTNALGRETLVPGLKKGGKAKDREAHAKGGRTKRDDGGSVKIPSTQHKFDSSGEMIPPTRYDIYNTRTGKIVGKAKSKIGSRRAVDRRDNDYGAYAHRAVPIYEGVSNDQSDSDRSERKSGGRTRAKGKTNINIVIAAGQKRPEESMMRGPGAPPPAGLPGGPGGPMPVPAPAPSGGGAPMPMPIPMPMPSGGGAGGPPMGRKSGGRISKVAKSYKDMEAGAATGEGRLQKTDIAKLHKDAPARKAGGRTMSYKDMTAGAESGKGRLQKTAIEKSQRLRGK